VKITKEDKKKFASVRTLHFDEGREDDFSLPV
jgi:hypothetical protein